MASEPTSIQAIPADFLPPLAHRPTRVFALPELNYPTRLNAAFAFLDRPIALGWGERAVYIDKDRRWTYRELARDANRLGNALLGLGVRPGDRVLLRLPDRIEQVVAILAILKIGAVAVPTFTLLRAPDLAYRARDTEAVAVIADGRFLDAIEEARPGFTHARLFIAVGATERAGYLDFHRLLDQGRDGLAAAPTRPDDLALILYTSGSTGTPKGCVQCHSDLLAIADGFCTYVMPIRPTDVIAGQPPIAFSMGIGFFLSYPLRFGVPAVLIEDKQPAILLEAIERHRVTILGAVPTFYNMLAKTAESEPHATATLRELRSAGEALTPAIAEAVRTRFGHPIRQAMGSTESLHIMASFRHDEPVREGSFGRAIPGFEIKVRDPESFEERPRDEPGILTFRGPTGAQYWRKPEIQAQAVRDGWSILQDIVCMDEAGYGRYIGRTDDMIVSAGYNIAPTEVEAVLAAHPSVLECACIGAADPEGRRTQVVKACIVLRPGLTASPELARQIQADFKARAAPHLYPRVIEFLPTLPKTPTGKVRRADLRNG
jgi:2-aminobenzoate-CoA ligase